MNRVLSVIATILVLAPVSVPAKEPAATTIQTSTLLRCSAAFAIIAGEQGRGVETARKYPPLQERGKEYFVRAGAQLIDDLGATREAVDAMMRAEVERLQEDSDKARDPMAYVDSVMQPCLAELEAAGL